MRRLSAAVLLCLALTLAVAGGCGDDNGGNGPASQRFDDPKGPIEVAADSEFEVTLDSNPSTGYSWKLTKPLQDGPVEYLGQDYEPSETDEQIVGAGGTAILKFRALESGEASIELEYVGPGSDATVAERHTILVTVGS